MYIQGNGISIMLALPSSNGKADPSLSLSLFSHPLVSYTSTKAIGLSTGKY